MNKQDRRIHMVNFWIKKHDEKLVYPKWRATIQTRGWFGITIQLGYLEIRCGV